MSRSRRSEVSHKNSGKVSISMEDVDAVRARQQEFEALCKELPDRRRRRSREPKGVVVEDNSQAEVATQDMGDDFIDIVTVTQSNVAAEGKC